LGDLILLHYDQTYHFQSNLIDQNHPWTEGQDCTSYIGCEVTITRSTEEVELDAGTYEVRFAKEGSPHCRHWL